jgi:hypothetical protein
MQNFSSVILLFIFISLNSSIHLSSPFAVLSQACWRNVKLYIAHSDDSNDVTFLRALNIVATSFRVQGQYAVAEEVLLRAYAGYELLVGHTMKIH